MDLAAAALVTPGELVFTAGRVAPLAEDAPYQWISHLQRPAGGIEAAEKDMDEFLAALLCSPALEVPAELRYEEEQSSRGPACEFAPRIRPCTSRESCGRNCPFE